MLLQLNFSVHHVPRRALGPEPLGAQTVPGEGGRRQGEAFNPNCI